MPSPQHAQASTVVLFPAGVTDSEACVAEVRRDARATVIVVDQTPFYPANTAWPDQPTDRGDVILGGIHYPVRDVQARVVESPDDKRIVLVEHILDPGVIVGPGDYVHLEVDASRRANISRQHSANHLMALALNQALVPCWRKNPDRLDALGHPDFDSVAILSSTIDEEQSLDIYRIGKSLKKSGFDVAELHRLKGLVRAMEASVNSWRLMASPISILCGGDTLESRRTWTTEIEKEPVRIPCGGTHPGNLLELGPITIEVSLEEPHLNVRTTCDHATITSETQSQMREETP